MWRVHTHWAFCRLTCCGVRVVEGDHNAEGSFHMVMIR